MSHYLAQTEYGVDMVVTSSWTEEETECVRSGVADGVELNYPKGFRANDLGFLSGLPIRRLLMLAWWIDDLSPIESLKETLSVLRFEAAPKASVDVGMLPKLVKLSAPWRSVANSVANAIGVRDLFLYGYGGSDLTPLASLEQLRSLTMKHYPNIRSLNGVNLFTRLENLEVYIARKLDDVSALSGASSLLSSLAISSCRKIASMNDIATCTSLTTLNIADEGDIDSIRPLVSLRNLEKLFAHGDTRILDNDLEPLLDLPRLETFTLASRRDYRPSVQRVRDIMASRLDEQAE